MGTRRSQSCSGLHNRPAGHATLKTLPAVQQAMVSICLKI